MQRVGISLYPSAVQARLAPPPSPSSPRPSPSDGAADSACGRYCGPAHRGPGFNRVYFAFRRHAIYQIYHEEHQV